MSGAVTAMAVPRRVRRNARKMLGIRDAADRRPGTNPRQARRLGGNHLSAGLVGAVAGGSRDRNTSASGGGADERRAAPFQARSGESGWPVRYGRKSTAHSCAARKFMKRL